MPLNVDVHLPHSQRVSQARVFGMQTRTLIGARQNGQC
jgi:hypothetical protein